MQANKVQVIVNTAIVQLIPELSPMLGQTVELIALNQEVKEQVNVPTPGILAGQIRLADDFDAPLPDELRQSFGETTALAKNNPGIPGASPSQLVTHPT